MTVIRYQASARGGIPACEVELTLPSREDSRARLLASIVSDELHGGPRSSTRRSYRNVVHFHQAGSWTRVARISSHGPATYRVELHDGRRVDPDVLENVGLERAVRAAADHFPPEALEAALRDKLPAFLRRQAD